MAAILAVAASDNWNNNGSWVGGVQPTAADDVTIVAGAVVTIPTAVTALARSVTIASTGALAFAATDSVLTIGDATAGASSVAFSNAGTITLTAVGTINFISTSATVQTVTSGGQTLPNLTFNAASNGSWQLSDNLTATGATLTLTKGTLDTNGKTVNAGQFTSAGAASRTLTLGASAITLTAGSTTAWNVSGSAIVLNANTSSITLSGSSANFAGLSLSYNSVSFTAAGTQSISGGANTFVNLTRTGTAVKTDIFNINVTGQTVTGTLALAGNSTINRLLVQSNTVGTARTITLGASAICKTGGTQNVDFMDITLAGGASNERDLSAITGLSGDAGGNSGITLTNAAAQTHTTSAGGSWSDVTKWTSRVPLPQDNVIVDANTTGTLTVDMPRIGADLTFTGFVGTLAMSTTVNRSYGAATLASGMTITSNQQWRLMGRGTHSFTSASITIPNSLLSFEGWGATYTLADTLNHTGATGVFIAAGAGVGAITFNTGGVTITTPAFTFQGGVTNLSSSTINTTGASGTIWTGSAPANATLNAGSSNIVISTTSASTRTFSGGGQTYSTLTYTVVGSAGQLTITGANTFTNVNITETSTNPRTVVFPATLTTTIVNLYLYGLNVQSSAGASAATLSISGTIFADYLPAVQDITATGTSFLARHSRGVSGNTGITFTDTLGNYGKSVVVGAGMSRSEVAN